MHVLGVVFDCDGTLVDTEPIWARARRKLYQDLTSRHRPETPIDEGLLKEMTGLNHRDSAAKLTGHLGLPELADQSAARLKDSVLGRLDALDPMPGVTDVLDRLRGKVPLAVATSAPREVTERSLDLAGLAASFGAVVCAGDPLDRLGRSRNGDVRTIRSKPCPDTYLAACARIGVRPERCLAVEDSDSGLRSAQAAGLTVLHVHAEALRQKRCDHRATSMDAPAARRFFDRALS
ncbi:HAD family hydrolase [Actinomadura hibisca]|uniref:HAD family hydrolase n=1 Tax=Actinomadura hibisca TaxID=68565 RepID=UPI0008373221|nr:HAD family phosphatase [Actinomadura hibisca]